MGTCAVMAQTEFCPKACGKCMARRLGVEAPKAIEISGVEVRLTQGLAGKLTPRLLQAMIDQDMIEPIEDSRSHNEGLVRIASFKIEYEAMQDNMQKQYPQLSKPDEIHEMQFSKSFVGGIAMVGVLMV